MHVIRAFLLFELIAFALASLAHAGIVVDGYEEPAASTAEAIIAIVLALGLGATYAFPAAIRGIGIAAQAFALVGTTIGLLLVLTVGPSTAPDIVFHIGIWLTLLIGLVIAARSAGHGPRKLSSNTTT